MLNRSNIEEANKHLQALYKRVDELEGIVQEQHEALHAKDSFIQTKIQELGQQDSLILKLKNQLFERDKLLQTKNIEIESLTHDITDKSKKLSFLMQRNKALNDFIKLASDLKQVSMKFDTVVDFVNDNGRYGFSDNTDSSYDIGYGSAFHNKQGNEIDDNEEDDEESEDDDDDNEDQDRNVSPRDFGNGGFTDFREVSVIEVRNESDIIQQYSSHVINGIQTSSDSIRQHVFSARKSSISEESETEERTVKLNSSNKKEVYF